MKLSRAFIKQFEDEQARYGTRVALSNVIWVLASGLLADLGIKRVRTAYRDE